MTIPEPSGLATAQIHAGYEPQAPYRTVAEIGRAHV